MKEQGLTRRGAIKLFSLAAGATAFARIPTAAAGKSEALDAYCTAQLLDANGALVAVARRCQSGDSTNFALDGNTWSPTGGEQSIYPEQHWIDEAGTIRRVSDLGLSESGWVPVNAARVGSGAVVVIEAAVDDDDARRLGYSESSTRVTLRRSDRSELLVSAIDRLTAPGLWMNLRPSSDGRSACLTTIGESMIVSWEIEEDATANVMSQTPLEPHEFVAASAGSGSRTVIGLTRRDTKTSRVVLPDRTLVANIPAGQLLGLAVVADTVYGLTFVEQTGELAMGAPPALSQIPN